MTTNPVWTGEKQGLSLEDERIAKLMRQFEGFVQLEEEQGGSAGASSSGGGGGSGKKK